MSTVTVVLGLVQTQAWRLTCWSKSWLPDEDRRRGQNLGCSHFFWFSLFSPASFSSAGGNGALPSSVSSLVSTRLPRTKERWRETMMWLFRWSWCNYQDHGDFYCDLLLGLFLVMTFFGNDFLLGLFWLRIGNQTWNVSCFEVSCSCTLLNPMGKSPPPIDSHHHSHHHHHHEYLDHHLQFCPIRSIIINLPFFVLPLPITISGSLLIFTIKSMFKVAIKITFKVTTIDLRALKDVLEATERLQEGDHRFLFILRFSGFWSLI